MRRDKKRRDSLSLLLQERSDFSVILKILFCVVSGVLSAYLLTRNARNSAQTSSTRIATQDGQSPVINPFSSSRQLFVSKSHIEYRLVTNVLNVPAHTTTNWPENKQTSTLNCDRKSRFCIVTNVCYYYNTGYSDPVLFTLNSIDWESVDERSYLIKQAPLVSTKEEFSGWNVWRIPGVSYMMSEVDSFDGALSFQKTLPLYELQKRLSGKRIDQAVLLTKKPASLWSDFVITLAQYIGLKSAADLEVPPIKRPDEPIDLKHGIRIVNTELMNPPQLKTPSNTIVCLDNAVFPWAVHREELLAVDQKYIDSFKADVESWFSLPVLVKFPPTVTIIYDETSDIIDNFPGFLNTIKKIVADYGYSVLYHPTDPRNVKDLEKMIRIYRTSGFVITVRNSNLMNALFMPKGAAILMIYPFKSEFQESKYDAVLTEYAKLHVIKYTVSSGQLLIEKNKKKFKNSKVSFTTCPIYSTAYVDKKCFELYESIKFKIPLDSNSPMRKGIIEGLQWLKKQL